MSEATSVFKSGANAAVEVGTWFLAVVSWTFVRPTSHQEFRNSRTNGGTAVATGFGRPGTISIFLDYDSANDPLVGSSLQFQENTFVSNLSLIKDTTTTPRAGWAVASALCTQVEENVVVDGKIGQRVSLLVNGSYSALVS